jgi:hypothetical protein
LLPRRRRIADTFRNQKPNVKKENGRGKTTRAPNQTERAAMRCRIIHRERSEWRSEPSTKRQAKEKTRMQSTNLPFRVKSFKISPEELEKVERQLSIASYYVNGDFKLDWEDRDEAGRAIFDALETLRQLKRQADIKM